MAALAASSWSWSRETRGGMLTIVYNCLCLVVVAVVLFWWLLSVVVLVVVVLCQKDINKLMYVSSGYIVG